METVLILGATSDIGEAIASKFAEKGHPVCLAARNSAALEPLQSDLNIRFRVPVSIFSFDANEFDTHEKFWQNLPDKPAVTICVFGYLGDQKAAQENWHEAEKIINTNYKGAVSMLNIVANEYEKLKTGTIIGISSVAGERGRQSNYIYGSAKAAFTAYLSGMRNRLTKSGVHVATINPGFVDTKMTEGLPLPKPLTAQPGQVAVAVYQAYKKKINVVYTLWMWRWIMLIIKNIPERLFKKMNL